MIGTGKDDVITLVVLPTTSHHVIIVDLHHTSMIAINIQTIIPCLMLDMEVHKVVMKIILHSRVMSNRRELIPS